MSTVGEVIIITTAAVEKHNLECRFQNDLNARLVISHKRHFVSNAFCFIKLYSYSYSWYLPPTY